VGGGRGACVVAGGDVADRCGEQVGVLAGGQVAAGESQYLRVHTDVAAARGGHWLSELVLRDRRTGQEEAVPAAALFVMIGATPHTDWLPEAIARDRNGYILTGRDLPAGDSPGDIHPRRTRSKPASPACSRPATCERAR
jgi:thioredoxin reductase (NADPH)